MTFDDRTTDGQSHTDFLGRYEWLKHIGYRSIRPGVFNDNFELIVCLKRVDHFLFWKLGRRH